MNASILAFGMPGTTELIVVAIIALLIFGRRVPETARSLGRSIMEFKAGLGEVQTTVNDVRTDAVRSLERSVGLAAPQDELRAFSSEAQAREGDSVRVDPQSTEQAKRCL